MKTKPEPLEKSEFWNRACHRVYGPRQGDAKIIIDAEDAETGAGKTSAQVFLARRFAKAFGYEFKKEDITLSGAEYIKRYREHPGREQPSVLCIDETVGAGAGDSRRAMSNSNLDLASAWQLMRMKRVVTISTLAHWSDLDVRLRRLATFRVNCRLNPIGHFRPYKIKVGFDDGKARTKKVDSKILFPDMEGDPFYEYITEDKDELIHAATWDADELQEEEGEDEEEKEKTPQDIADEIIDNGIDEYVDTRQNGKSYYNKTWIKADYGLSRRAAKEVKQLIEREKDPEEVAIPA